jgi:predicted esterase
MEMVRLAWLLVLLSATACGSTPEREKQADDDDDGSGGAGGAGAQGPAGPGSGGGGEGPGGAGPGGSGAGGGGTGIDPSNGMGGPIQPGQEGTSPLGAILRMPVGYDPATFASPVIWLFNETIPQWQAIADPDRVVLVDLQEYNDVNAIVEKLNETTTILETQYNVDKARYFWAGWSAGGNIAIILGSQNQSFLSGTLVFPGTGGNYAQPHMQMNMGHKMRLYYACGDQDPNFDWMAVQYEANYWQGLGYETRFDPVAGAPHYLDEAVYGVRAAGWAWIRGFHLQN